MSLTDVDRVSEVIGQLQTLDLELMIKDVMAEQGEMIEGSTKGLGAISLTSLHAMQSPTMTSCLYAGPDDPSKRLLPLCIKIRDAFASAGFMVTDDRPLKLHATILNTVYAKNSGQKRARSPSKEKVDRQPLAATESNEAQPTSLAREISLPGTARPPDTFRGHGRNSRAPMKLDATQLLEKCKDFVWASEFAIEKLAICKMGAKKILDNDGNVIDEQYEEVASIVMPA
jgi:activating signal cointegrator complex subunit 1